MHDLRRQTDAQALYPAFQQLLRVAQAEGTEGDTAAGLVPAPVATAGQGAREVQPHVREGR
jgi:hypothetical protein